jgi:hypothetical protein
MVSLPNPIILLHAGEKMNVDMHGTASRQVRSQPLASTLLSVS